MRPSAASIRQRQGGYAVLLGLLGAVLLVGGLTLEAQRLRPSATGAATSADPLARARAALVAYNVDDDALPGALPCPDFVGDGIADIHCQSGSAPVYTERLPWRTLDMPHGPGKLWYALDRDFRDNPDPMASHPVVPLNSTAQGGLRIDGEGGFAAVVMAPGDALAHQRRTHDGIDAYLEADNRDGDARFTRCRGDASCNDRVLGVRAADLLAPVRERVLSAVRARLDAFAEAHGRYPWAAPLGQPEGTCQRGTARGAVPIARGDCAAALSGVPAWLRANAWHRSLFYAVAPGCAEPGTACSTAAPLRLGAETDRAVVWAAAGAPIVTPVLGRRQRRIGAAPHAVREYLDHRRNTDGDAVFTREAPTGGGNDLFHALPAR